MLVHCSLLQHPQLTLRLLMQVLEMVTCVRLKRSGASSDDLFVLQASPDISCEDGTYVRWVVFAGESSLPRHASPTSSVPHSWLLGTAVPAFIIVVVGAPVAAILVLRSLRAAHTTDDPFVRRKYGFLFMGYQPHAFFWEAVILLRKVGASSRSGCRQWHGK